LKFKNTKQCLEYIVQTGIKQCNLQRKSAPYEIQCFTHLLIHAAAATSQHYVTNSDQYEHLLQISQVAAQYVKAILGKSNQGTVRELFFFEAKNLNTNWF